MAVSDNPEQPSTTDPEDRLATPEPEVAPAVEADPVPAALIPRVRSEVRDPVVRRFWSAEDFRARRQDEAGAGRAARRRRAARAPKWAEREVAGDRIALAAGWNGLGVGSRTIGFLDVSGHNPLEAVAAAAGAIGGARAGGVVAWDGSTTLPTDRALTVADLAGHVRADATGCFDVLAGGGQAVPALGTLRELARFYNVVLVAVGLDGDGLDGDGLNGDGRVPSSILEALDLLVLVVPATEDAGYDALESLDQMARAGAPDPRRSTVTVLIDPPGAIAAGLIDDLTEALTQRTRAVHRIPQGPQSTQVRRSWLRACAQMSALL